MSDLCTASGTKVPFESITQATDRKYPETTCPVCGEERVSVSPKWEQATDGMYRVTRHQPKGTPTATRTATPATATATKPASRDILSDPLSVMRLQRDEILKAITDGPALLVAATRDLALFRKRVADLEAQIAGHSDKMTALDESLGKVEMILSAATDLLNREPQVLVVDRPETETPTESPSE